MCGIGLVVTALLEACSDCDNSSINHHSSLSDTANSPSLVAHLDHGVDSSKFDHELQRRLCQRGPDHYAKTIRRVTTEPKEGDLLNGFAITMDSAVLHLRGDKVTPQPVEDSSGNVLCWNGEVFDMEKDTSIPLEEEQSKLMQGSDTVFLSEKLQLAGEKLQQLTMDEMEASDPVVDVLRRVRGPFAVVWLHESSKRLYFGHDRFGRRSLVYRRWGRSCGGDMIADLVGSETTSTEFRTTDFTRFVLGNVAVGDEGERMQYQELPASGIYVLDLRGRTDSDALRYRMEFHPYAPLAAEVSLPVPCSSEGEKLDYILDRFGCKLPCPTATSKTDPEDAKTLESSALALLVALSNAVGVRVRTIPPRPFSNGVVGARVAVLFSGGLDSVVIAALSHFHAPVDEPVDLLAVCFDENSCFASPDRRAAELAHAELCALFPERQWNLVKINVPREDLASKQGEVQALMAPCDTHMDFNIGAAFWFLSRGRGEMTNSVLGTGNATLEKLNAFLKPQRHDLRELEAEIAALALFGDQAADDNMLLCPVHRCGRKRKLGCALGICKSCCIKMQRAVEKIIPHSVDHRESQGYRIKLVSMGIQSDAHLDLLLDLLKTRRQEQLDGELKAATLPLLCCRVHRSKQGQNGEQTQAPASSASTTAICKSANVSEYQTGARVVLVGIGADEQLAGYGRHRTTLMNRGEEALRSELQMDLGRIWKRNLGRDDRCIAAHGREARFPYLDENVVSTIATFPVSSLCDGELPRGVGDKRALRLVAKTLGHQSCAGLAKRAIQFGSRIAKVSNTGSNRQTQGMNKFSSVE